MPSSYRQNARCPVEPPPRPLGTRPVGGGGGCNVDRCCLPLTTSTIDDDDDEEEARNATDREDALSAFSFGRSRDRPTAAAAEAGAVAAAAPWSRATFPARSSGKSEGHGRRLGEGPWWRALLAACRGRQQGRRRQRCRPPDDGTNEEEDRQRIVTGERSDTERVPLLLGSGRRIRGRRDPRGHGRGHMIAAERTAKVRRSRGGSHSAGSCACEVLRTLACHSPPVRTNSRGVCVRGEGPRRGRTVAVHRGREGPSREVGPGRGGCILRTTPTLVRTRRHALQEDRSSDPLDARRAHHGASNRPDVAGRPTFDHGRVRVLSEPTHPSSSQGSCQRSPSSPRPTNDGCQTRIEQRTELFHCPPTLAFRQRTSWDVREDGDHTSNGQCDGA
jgi:hypothetical protein